MSEIVGLILPFFGLIALGYGAGRFRFVTDDNLGGLNFLVYYLALPALFFHSVVAAPAFIPGAFAFIVTTTFATYCAFAIAFSIGALINGGNVPEATIEGLGGSYSYIAYLAPALTLAAFGSAAAVPTALIFSFDNAMLTTLTPLMMALGGTVRTNPAKLAQEIARNVFLHPIVIATTAGLLVAAIGTRLPQPIDAFFAFLRSAAAPAALFVFGVTLSLRPMGKVTVEMPAMVFVKLIAHPFIVYLLLAWIGGFDPVWVHTAILLAALPPAMNVYALAREYGVYSEQASNTILLATAVSVATVTIALILLLNDILPANPFR
jgi:malonate transporter